MKNVIFLTLVLMFQSSHAEKLIFTNNNEEVDIEGEAQIDFETGDISVTTVGEHLIVDSGTSTPVILGFYPDDYDITFGDTITVNWSVAYAASCQASVNTGAATWSGSKNATNGTWSQGGVSVTQLPAILSLDCENADGASTIANFTITEQVGGGGGGGDPEISFFRVNGSSSTVTVSGSASVSWSASDVSGCTASASPAVSGWNGSKGLSGNQNVAFTQSTNLTLTCDSEVANVNVIFNDNPNCTADIYPNGLDIIQKTYVEINDNQPFGVSVNTDVLEDIGLSQFLSASDFSLPQNNFTRVLGFEQAPTNHNLMKDATISVSECPGDFSPTAACVFQVNNFSNIRVSNDPSVPSVLIDCFLNGTTSYYFNVVMSADPYNVSPSCNSGSDPVCAIFYTEGSF